MVELKALSLWFAGGKPPEDWSKRQLEMREAKAEAASVHIAQLVADKNCETHSHPLAHDGIR